MYLLGLDLGSSSVKGSLLSVDSNKTIASSFFPKKEMKISAEKSGWAEQDTELWWSNLKLVVQDLMSQTKIAPEDIKGIGISYQMHGLVMVDKNQKAIRSSIIWCDSRAVEIGRKAFTEIGDQKCLGALLNSPGNFTASKLKWVKENEPQNYEKIYKIMLPGDYIAMKMTGEINTSISGLSEGIFWDFSKKEVASFLLDYYGFDHSFIPNIAPTFGKQGELNAQAASELGLKYGTPVTYRAGDQPNNAFSLNVLHPGEIAATAGTSGVVYGVSEEIKFDPLSRVNTFAHVNYNKEINRLGVLLCINGTGILNAWLKKNIGDDKLSYNDMNNLAATIPIGSEGLVVLPFGNGAERMLKNRDLGCQFLNLNFNVHFSGHLIRASQAGIAFAFKYGMEIMQETGIKAKVIKAGNTNMFQSQIFRNNLAGITGANIELYDTDGSQGAARGAGIGAGIFSSFEEAFSGLQKFDTVEPIQEKLSTYNEAYLNWKSHLEKFLNCVY